MHLRVHTTRMIRIRTQIVHAAPDHEEVEELSGETLGGSWFEARMREAVEASGKPEPEQPRIMRELLLRLSGKKKEGQ